jgi:hypothetical protein
MTLFFVLVIGMIGRAVLRVGPGALALSNDSLQKAAAQRASESGLEYALAKLRQNPEWRGNDDRVTVNTTDLFVVEDRGNVIGLMTSGKGRVSQFRIRFNYQDGSPGAEELNDPEIRNVIDSQYVSVNNLQQESESVVPRADTESWNVSNPDEGPYTIPVGTACVTVEGRAGNGLAKHLASDPNAALSGPVSRHVAEAFFQVGLAQRSSQASLMGGGDISFVLPEGGKVRSRVKNAKGAEGVKPRLRSKGSVTVLADGLPGTLEMEEGVVGRDEDKPPGFVAEVKGSVELDQESVGDGVDFFNLKWDDVEKAMNGVEIPGGTYVHWDDGTTHYYDMTFDDYKAFMAAGNESDPGVVLGQDFKEVRSGENLTSYPDGLRVRKYEGATRWSLKNDLQVNPSTSGVEEFATIPRSGAAFSPSDTSDLIPLATPDKYDVRSVKFQVNDVTVSVPGDAHIFAQVAGKNSTLTSEGDLTFITNGTNLRNNSQGSQGKEKKAGPKKLELNLYVKGDIEMSTYRGGRFNNVVMDGLVYTWGNFTAVLGDETVKGWRQFRLSGVLVAYGADPSTESPGSDGSGNIHIQAKRVDLTWDDSKMAQLLDFESSPVTLKRTAYRVY